MLENERLECIQSIKFGISRTALWREKIGAQYPSDTRNGRAADCLAELASSPAELSYDAWSQLQPHFDWSSEPWREAISQTARLAEFKAKITNLPAFVTALIEVFRLGHSVPFGTPGLHNLARHGKAGE
jgi:hypothetical protein